MSWDLLARTVVPGTPRPQGKIITRRHGLRGIGHHPRHVTDHRDRVGWAIRRAWEPHISGHGPLRFDGAIRLELTFGFPRPKAHYGTGRNADVLKTWAPDRHTQTPDVDKLSRLVCDALEGSRLIRNDSQVCELHAIKAWASAASTTITIWGWDAHAQS